MNKPILTNTTVFSLTIIGIGLLILSIIARNFFVFIMSICLIYFPLYIYDKQNKKKSYKDLDKEIGKSDLKINYVKLGERLKEKKEKRENETKNIKRNGCK